MCVISEIQSFLHVSAGPPSVPIFFDVGISAGPSFHVSWRLNGGDSADFYIIHWCSCDLHQPFPDFMNTRTTSSFHGYTRIFDPPFIQYVDYSIAVRGVNCGSQMGNQSAFLSISAGTYWARYNTILSA